MAEQVRVFVSHHHSPDEDKFTARLVHDIEAAGADVWVDDTGVTSGSFIAKIGEGLEGRQWLIVVMTPDSLRSPWVRTEVDTGIGEYTAGRMHGILPIVMRPCSERDIPVLWRKFHRYLATKNYETARDGILAAIGLFVPEVPDVPPVQITYTTGPGGPATVPIQRTPGGPATVPFQPAPGGPAPVPFYQPAPVPLHQTMPGPYQQVPVSPPPVPAQQAPVGPAPVPFHQPPVPLQPAPGGPATAPNQQAPVGPPPTPFQQPGPVPFQQAPVVQAPAPIHLAPGGPATAPNQQTPVVPASAPASASAQSAPMMPITVPTALPAAPPTVPVAYPPTRVSSPQLPPIAQRGPVGEAAPPAIVTFNRQPQPLTLAPRPAKSSIISNRTRLLAAILFAVIVVIGIVVAIAFIVHAQSAASSDTATPTATASFPAPTASFDVIPDASAPGCYNFDASASIGYQLTYSWEFGDGATDNAPTVYHCYAVAGDYNVTLTVTDAYSRTATTNQDVTSSAA